MLSPYCRGDQVLHRKGICSLIPRLQGLPRSELGLAIGPQGFLGWEEQQPGQTDISQLLTCIAHSSLKEHSCLGRQKFFSLFLVLVKREHKTFK